MGKTPFALYPHPSLGKRLTQIAFDRVASQLRGIPEEWVKDRVTVVTPGYDAAGQRAKGNTWYRLIIEAVSQRFEADTIVLDTLSHMAQSRYFDVIAPKGGIPSEKYTEYHAPQNMVKEVLEKVMSSNPQANVIVLTHAKEKRNERHDVVGIAPELVGNALASTWASRFEAVLAMERRVIKGKTAKHILILEKTPLYDFLLARSGFKKRTAMDEMDITITEEGDYAPIEKAWDAVFASLA